MDLLELQRGGSSGVDHIVALATDRDVNTIALAIDESIVAGSTIENVVVAKPDEDVVSLGALQIVSLSSSLDQ